MNRIITSVLMCLVAVAAVAEEKADIMVSYRYQYPTVQDSVNGKSVNMTFLCNSSKAKYFNTMSEYCDSLTSTPDGKKRLREIQMAAWVSMTPEGITVDKSKGNAPEKKVNTYIFTDADKNEITVFDKFGDELRTYSEPFNEQQWEISGDSTTTVLGYDCIMATGHYHGRDWHVWFAPELPVSFGPWKLHGLPGLILRAEADGGFAFEATGIEKSDRPMLPVYSRDDYADTERRKALADEEYAQKNALKLLQAKYGITITSLSAEERKYDKRYAIECDYE